MPIAQISIARGRPAEKVARMAKLVTQAIAETLDAPIDTIRVVVTEVEKDRWFAGGESLAERAANAGRTP